MQGNPDKYERGLKDYERIARLWYDKSDGGFMVEINGLINMQACRQL